MAGDRTTPDRGSSEERVQQLDALGALVGTVAHDFNNVITVIAGNLEILLDDLAEESPLRPFAEAALEAADDGGALTEQLITLTRHKPLRPAHVDVHALLQRCRPLLQASVGARGSIALASTAPTCIAYVDPGQLRAALLNLTVNARDAMKEGGRVRIITGRVDRTEPDGTVVRLIAIEVGDEGTGMPPTVVEQATKPFFTTKGEGEGTGLGLAMVADFVERSKGALAIESEVDVGTTVRLYLPEGDNARIDGRPQSLPRADRGGGSERLLVVENDAAVRAMIARYLTDLGYDVLEAVDDATALSISDCSDGIDLVLVDVPLAAAGRGGDLVRTLRERRPGCPLVAMAGGRNLQEFDPEVVVIAKPFRLRDLARRVRQALDDPAPG
jgi:CheY-like chemotaxis protein